MTLVERPRVVHVLFLGTVSLRTLVERRRIVRVLVLGTVNLKTLQHVTKTKPLNLMTG